MIASSEWSVLFFEVISAHTFLLVLSGTLLGICLAYLQQRLTGEPNFWRYLCADELFRQSTLTDAIFSLVNRLVFSPYLNIISYSIAVGLGLYVGTLLRGEAGGSLDHPDTTGALPPGGLFVVALAAFIVSDFAQWLSHYLLHRFACLWELHKVHHSATFLTMLTNHRHHPLACVFTDVVDGVLVSIVYAFVFYCYGNSLDTLTLAVFRVWFAVKLASFATLHHSHFYLRLPILNLVVMDPASHIMHHSSAVRHANCNFGGMLSIWDRLFGTYRAPEPRETYSLGLIEQNPIGQRLTDLPDLYIEPVFSAARVMHSQCLALVGKWTAWAGELWGAKSGRVMTSDRVPPLQRTSSPSPANPAETNVGADTWM
jgi:sterol desaturase/sphingolipid hydroxylase (fatty acid hydroxylase superfamily)